MGRDSATSLAPGFRFHPTDEEIVRYYLRRKVSGKPLCFDTISVVDIYKSEPWDLPEKSKLRTRDLEWYFFSPLDKKYSNSSRTNRATENGYWKTTGKDRPVRHNSRVVGMKKTLVYHSGRAPRGARSNWVMHEYRLTDEDLEKAGVVQDAFVLCRIFQKSGSGPKNGEQYGAPFIEEEWENDEDLTLPGEEAVVNEGLVNVDDDMHLEVDEIVQYFDGELPFEYDQPLSNYLQDTINPVELPNVLVENDNKPLELQHNHGFFQLPEQYEMGGNSEKDECFAESSGNLAESSDNLKDEDIDYLLDEPYPSVPDDLALNEELFLEANDLSSPVETDPTGVDILEEYLTFFDADDNLQLSFDPTELFGSEVPISGQTIPEEKVNEVAENEFLATKQTSVASINDASTSKLNTQADEAGSDSTLPFLKRVSYLLGDIPAPPAFASEYPSKDMAIRLNSAAQTSSSIHRTAGMIHISNSTSNYDLVNTLYGKNGDVDLILFSARHHHHGENDEMIDVLSQKNGIMGTRGGFLFFFLLFWVLILSVSYKVGSCIYSH
ncbi:NAC domain-containing protein 78-like isoform X2 [Cucurbita pepo subsp. pepo]|uniref:NAC domain-containing protein 78-like isoform X2 n=1 Tax=Cucurbita pepo subsp. pepo TaxID=3664 RepID=UPI000C9D3359|nr:NAC domain-containing protein 78-like isoform X2 [Cucurbita pepo subsp. pepo]